MLNAFFYLINDELSITKVAEEKGRRFHSTTFKS